jgi:putative ABC transport system ATP-binding protein
MLLQLKNVSKMYQLGEVEIHALREVSINIDKGEFVAIMGPSGSGKSTFLQVASMLNGTTGGEISLNGKRVEKYNEVEQARLRNQEIGFIFQQFNLLPRTSAIDNVALPLLYAKVDPAERRKKSIAMLIKVGLGERLENKPSQLSGGQQQRVAIARALINFPSIIFADEPTGNLDSKSGEEIKKILKDLNDEGRTIILVTHEEDVALIAKRLVFFHDGEILYDEKYGWNKKVKTDHEKQVIEELKQKLKKMKRDVVK